MIHALKEIVLQAGNLIRQGCHGDVRSKPGQSNFVTEYDVKVQRFLIEKLGALSPGCTFVCEEEGLSENRIENGPVYIIDPIDGTTNFLCGLPFCGISVAFAQAGETKMGVVYNPFREELFWAKKGKGAYLNETLLKAVDRPLEKGVLNFSNAPYDVSLREAAFALEKAVYPHTMDIRELGSAALSLCYIAANRCVAYYSPGLCVWDYAAAACVLGEAGGVILCADGSPTAYRSHIPILGGVPQAAAEFLQIVEAQQ